MLQCPVLGKSAEGMAMGRRAPTIVLEDHERETLFVWRRRRKTANDLHVRAGIVLDAEQGLKGVEIAQRIGVSQQTVTKWRHRCLTD